ncbi:adenylate/guanylate cyclase domain-containing protein [Nocardioides alcanivorans]|uniref:adenylate/guanylate cyclase domain-containing protein n=1 Tax=Nocardioides alcanivorans TaxID=2897352 RepID=UPI001F2312C6|nr:adenylate/guanylate cyclase domain-containing protein [Nocardioides alcanivorans]
MTPAVIALLTLSIVLLAATLASVTRLHRTRSLLAQSQERVRDLEAQLPQGPRSLSHRAADLALKAVVSTARGVREHGVGGFLAASIEDVTGWSVADRLRINKLAGPDGTVTVLFSDIEGSTALNEQLGDDDWMALLGEHDAVVRAEVRRHRGHVVKHQGDGFMIVFGSSQRAAQAATGIQANLADAQSPALVVTPIRVRMGIHRGPTIAKDGDYFGRNVALAARIAAAAAGGEVLVSDDVRALLGEDWSCVDPRDLDLKGFPGSHRAWLLHSCIAPRSM